MQESVMKDKIGVTARSIIQRLNRRLAPDQMIKSNRRSDRLTEQMGVYYVLDVKQKRVAQRNVDLVQLAKKLGVMDPWEELTEE